jgi:hypothetical protein
LAAQSVFPPHSLPAVQVAPQVAPPQSRSVSAPFFTASLQRGAAQAPAVQTPLAQAPESVQAAASAIPAQKPPVQVPDWQSAPEEQTAPLMQSAPQLPPQSGALSVPFVAASRQVAGAQILPAVGSGSVTKR